MSDENKEDLLKLIGKYSDLSTLRDFASTIEELGVCSMCGKFVHVDALEQDGFFEYCCPECLDK